MNTDACGDVGMEIFNFKIVSLPTVKFGHSEGESPI